LCRPSTTPASCKSIAPVACAATIRWPLRFASSTRRDWYGRIRGSDGIFSFHPFAPESVSDNGIGRSVKMRSVLETSGVIAKYDPEKHSPQVINTRQTEVTPE